MGSVGVGEMLAEDDTEGMDFPLLVPTLDWDCELPEEGVPCCLCLNFPKYVCCLLFIMKWKAWKAWNTSVFYCLNKKGIK